DLALAVELPCAEVLGALLATARKVAVFARPAQLAYLRRLARPLEILRLPHEADRARDRLTSFRAAIRAQLEASDYSHDLLALTPLFDEYDPALVAAALLRARESESAVQPSAPVAVPTWVHLHLNVGRQDRVRTGDVVGALLNAVGLSRDHIGRVDVRESFTVVEVREEAAHRALQGLRGVPLRGRAVAVRFDQR
ncbi:MAG: DbpA RNA binding domain-containing protein, partial [Armatimonadota bacterium]